MQRERPATETVSVTGPDGFREACDRLLAEAPGHIIRIFSPCLDGLLNREAVSEALHRRIRTNRHTRIQVLFEDAAQAVQDGHRLITFARRWPDFASLRRVAPDVREQAAWLQVEPHDLLWRPDHLHYRDGLFGWGDKRKAPQLRRQFDEWWQRA